MANDRMWIVCTRCEVDEDRRKDARLLIAKKFGVWQAALIWGGEGHPWEQLGEEVDRWFESHQDCCWLGREKPFRLEFEEEYR